jgi:hypothetical protein
MEENLFIVFHVLSWNRPGVSVGNGAYIFIKRVIKFLMNSLKASATRRMGDNHEFAEARIFNVLFPDKTCMLLHTLHKRNSFAFIISFVWIHNNDWDLVLDCPIYLGYHRPQLKSIIQANTSCPDTCSYSTRALDQNESPLS